MSLIIQQQSIMDTDDVELEERMKSYEKTFDVKTVPYKPYVVRLDGRSFSKYTEGLRKPFDNLFECAMINTMNDLVVEFCASTGYTHSDEITLIFPAACTLEEYNTKTNKSIHLYEGRVMKICTVMAGYCSSKFNYHINRLIDYGNNRVHYKNEMIEKIRSHNACFDCRLIDFPENKLTDIVNLLIWRSVRDSYRNSVFAYGKKYFTHQQLENKNSDQILTMLKEEKNLDWNDVPIFHKHGVYSKKEWYKKEVEINGVMQEVPRQRICNKSFVIKYSEKMYELLMSKHWASDNLDSYETVFYNVSCSSDGTIKLF